MGNDDEKKSKEEELDGLVGEDEQQQQSIVQSVGESTDAATDVAVDSAGDTDCFAKEKETNRVKGADSTALPGVVAVPPSEAASMHESNEVSDSARSSSKDAFRNRESDHGSQISDQPGAVAVSSVTTALPLADTNAATESLSVGEGSASSTPSWISQKQGLHRTRGEQIESKRGESGGTNTSSMKEEPEEASDVPQAPMDPDSWISRKGGPANRKIRAKDSVGGANQAFTTEGSDRFPVGDSTVSELSMPTATGGSTITSADDPYLASTGSSLPQVVMASLVTTNAADEEQITAEVENRLRAEYEERLASAQRDIAAQAPIATVVKQGSIHSDEDDKDENDERKRTKCYILVAVALLVVIGVSVGVAVPLSSKRDTTSGSPSTASSGPGARSPSVDSTGDSGPIAPVTSSSRAPTLRPVSPPSSPPTSRPSVAPTPTPITWSTGDTWFGEQENGEFGESVSMSYDATLLAVGMPYFNSGTVQDAGSVSIFSINGTSLNLLQTLYGVVEESSFGQSVALSGDGSTCKFFVSRTTVVFVSLFSNRAFSVVFSSGHWAGSIWFGHVCLQEQWTPVSGVWFDSFRWSTYGERSDANSCVWGRVNHCHENMGGGGNIRIQRYRL